MQRQCRRGRLHVEIMDADFPGETQEGVRSLVAKVRAAVNVRFQGGVQQPDTLWTDHGKGFYSPNSGVMTLGYKEALREHHFKAALGENASVQPGNLQELMLHEIAVAWLRVRLARTIPAKAWEESREDYVVRLKAVCADVNATCDVEALCRGFLKRIDQLVDQKGGRLAR